MIGFGRRGDRSPRLRFKTGHATFTASGTWRLPIPWHGQFLEPRNLERFPFTAPTHVSSHPLGSLRRLRAFSPLLAPRSFRRPSPRQPIRGVTLSLCFEGVSHPCCHAVGTFSRERQQGVTSFLTSVLR